MIRLKNEKEIAGIRESGRLLAGTLEELKKLVAPGISTHEMDSFARSWIESHGGKPAFLGYMNYPASLCVSVNSEVIHGIPGARAFRRHLAENGVKPGAGVNVFRDAIALVGDRAAAPLAA